MLEVVSVSREGIVLSAAWLAAYGALLTLSLLAAWNVLRVRRGTPPQRSWPVELLAAATVLLARMFVASATEGVRRARLRGRAAGR